METKTQEVAFLDFKIKNTGNSDGWVLLGKVPGSDLSSTHLGNFSELDEAKRNAVLFFMMFRPVEFERQVANRALYGSGCSHEYFKLVKIIAKEGLAIPDEITKSDDLNFSIIVCGKPLNPTEKVLEREKWSEQVQQIGKNPQLKRAMELLKTMVTAYQFGNQVTNGSIQEAIDLIKNHENGQ